MAQKLVQAQTLTQTQTLAPQQLLLVRLLELPVSELEERVKNELVDNAALEEGDHSLDDISSDEGQSTDEATEVLPEDPYAGKDTQSEEALADYLSADDIPDYLLNRATEARERNEVPFGENISFYEQLHQQISEHELTEHQQQLLEYLIGSLDDDGLLRKDLSALSDELAIYHNIETDEIELEGILKILHDFEPRGIGARSLQECLHLQINTPEYRSAYKKEELIIIDKYYDDFTHKRWDKIQGHLNVSDDVLEHIQAALRRLNPRPGNALDEMVGHSFQQIIPDFIVENDGNGSLIVHLNSGEVPELRVSGSFKESIKEYTHNKTNLTREQRDAFQYTKQKVDAAQNFIDAIKQRQHTLLITMEAIVELQRPFFEEGDEMLLQPMILKNVAARTGLDISTISRVSNSKYVQTDYGIYSLKYFFNDKFTTEDGEEHSTLKIKNRLKELIDNEEKRHPLTDEALAALLKEEGIPVARRTVAKYREQLGIPIARLRK